MDIILVKKLVNLELDIFVLKIKIFFVERNIKLYISL